MHGILQVSKSVLSQQSASRQNVGEMCRYSITLSQSVIPFVKAVSASITLFVSSHNMLAYLNRTLASNRGANFVLSNTTSRHPNPVATSF